MGWCSSSAGEADAGDANEGEMVRLVRPGAGTDEVGSAGLRRPIRTGRSFFRTRQTGQRQRRGRISTN
jgi:hypothetical protein